MQKTKTNKKNHQKYATVTAPSSFALLFTATLKAEISLCNEITLFTPHFLTGAKWILTMGLKSLCSLIFGNIIISIKI